MLEWERNCEISFQGNNDGCQHGLGVEEAYYGRLIVTTIGGLFCKYIWISRIILIEVEIFDNNEEKNSLKKVSK